MGKPGPVALGRHGPWVVTTLDHARAVLTDPVRFDFPTDVSRRALKGPDAQGAARSPRSITPALEPEAVARGSEVFTTGLDDLTPVLRSQSSADCMQLLRSPVSRATTSALLPQLDESARDRVAELVLGWIDALGPVIARRRPPARWSRLRRREAGAHDALLTELAAARCPDPPGTAIVLAAGIQVPIAAGAWLLVKLAEDRETAEVVRTRPELARAVAWETIRLCPPTWITARITAEPVRIGSVSVPEGAVVMVSPLLLGRLESLAPGADSGAASLDEFDPLRWDQDRVRPGAWLPFGAGPHACPGRNLGLAQLTILADWARRWRLSLLEPVSIDQSRGIFPRPARLGFEPC